MTILTCASYYGTGSSAVTDLISEYSGVKSLTNYEFRFAHDPDGISELEFNLVENFNRHNSGHALKRYRKLVDYYGNHRLAHRYEPFFHNQWKKLSYEYIDALTDFSYPGFWQYDFYDRGPWFEFWNKLPERVMQRTLWRNQPDRHLFFLHETTLASHPTEEKFLKCTRDYTTALMKAANPENAPFLMVDQILPSSNIERHMRYFDNIKAIVVERDPRDLYLLAKYDWNDPIVPQEIETFCKWFEYIRSTRDAEHWDPEKIILVRFEDLIYHFEETRDALIQWVGLDESQHVRPGTTFDPSVSIKNTRYWIQHPEHQQEADYIAQRLPQFLYEEE